MTAILCNRTIPVASKAQSGSKTTGGR